MADGRAAARRRPQPDGRPTCSSSPTSGACTCCAGRRRVAPRHVAGGLADLPRRSRRQPLQPARPDQSRPTSRAWRRAWMFTLPGASSAAGDAGRGRRRHVRHHRQRVLRARRRQRAGASGTISGRARRASPATPRRGINRGVAVAGDRVFMVTDHAHLLALEPLHRRRCCGRREMADWRQNYGATSAPLVVGNLVVVRDLGRRRRRPRVPGRVRSARPARKRGGSGRCRGRASPARRPGRGTDIEHRLRRRRG